MRILSYLILTYHNLIIEDKTPSPSTPPPARLTPLLYLPGLLGAQPPKKNRQKTSSFSTFSKNAWARGLEKTSKNTRENDFFSSNLVKKLEKTSSIKNKQKSSVKWPFSDSDFFGFVKNIVFFVFCLLKTLCFENTLKKARKKDLF